MLALTFAATVQISVLSSFHPTSLEVRPSEGTTLIVESQGRTEVLRNGRPVRLTGPARVAGRNGALVRFKIAIPQQVEREYVGRLEVRVREGVLQAIVEMDRETAVASIVEAEGTAGIPFEARKAQAVVTRSYLIAAGRRHATFDFCDREHCQFMRGTPGMESDAMRASRETRAQVLTYRGTAIAALYSASCGGHTRTLADAGWQGASWTTEAYPFHSVSCPYRGKASGHGVGLCQMGAIEIAKHGIMAPLILHHYFPHTSIDTITTDWKRQPAHAQPAEANSLAFFTKRTNDRASILLAALDAAEAKSKLARAAARPVNKATASRATISQNARPTTSQNVETTMLLARPLQTAALTAGMGGRAVQ